MLAIGGPVIAAGAVVQVTDASVQLEFTAPRNSPPFGDLSSVALPTVSRSFADATVGQLVPAPVPETLNFNKKSLAGLLSTVSRLAVPRAAVGLALSMVASSVGAKARVPPPVPPGGG